MASKWNGLTWPALRMLKGYLLVPFKHWASRYETRQVGNWFLVCLCTYVCIYVRMNLKKAISDGYREEQGFWKEAESHMYQDHPVHQYTPHFAADYWLVVHV